MKVIIDIPEEHYLNLIKTDENGENEIPLGLLFSLWDCVKYNCTLLPKGHGDLIDVIKLKAKMFDLPQQPEGNYWDGVDAVGELIDNTQIIIPAESEEE